MGYWGQRRLHLFSGSVQDGVTVDIKRDLRPTVVCDIGQGVPFKDNVFDTVLMDPPYSERMANDLYGVPLVSIPGVLKEAARVARYNGYIILLDWRVWMIALDPSIEWEAIYAVHVAARAVTPLRALQIWRKKPTPLESFTVPTPDSDGGKEL